MQLSSQISAVVTGGASGLGEATARALAAKGVKVGIFDMNAERGASVAEEIGATFAKVNVADEASVDAGFEAVRDANGTERILVNCAGIGLGMKTASRKRDTGDILAHDVGAFKRVIDINLFGSFLCASKSAAHPREYDPAGFLRDPDLRTDETRSERKPARPCPIPEPFRAAARIWRSCAVHVRACLYQRRIYPHGCRCTDAAALK